MIILENVLRRKIIENELSNLYQNLKSRSEKSHSADPSKKSMSYLFEFNFPEGQ